MDMFNNHIQLFIALLIEEDHNRNFLRSRRKQLREEMDPFEIPDQRFIQFFRLDKPSTVNLIHDIMPFVVNRNGNGISLTKRVLGTLHFLAVGSFQNSVGANTWLAVSQTMVSKIINEICHIIATNLLPIWVKFPTRNEEIIAVKQEFFRKFGFRGVLGCVDGTHVEIIAPPARDADHPPFVYINRKGKHSINVMLISDANAKILACNARFPGSVHDSAIWQMSTIRNHLQQPYEQGDIRSRLIADSGYPLEPWIFTPFANPTNPREEWFNNLLATTRNVIERTNGILKGRFRCVSRLRTLMYHPLKAANIIYTCCVLHNIAHQAHLLDDDDMEIPEDDDGNGAPAAANCPNILQLGAAARAEYIRNNFR